MLLKTIHLAQERTEETASSILNALGLPRATYFRWIDRQASGTLVDGFSPGRPVLSPTPVEVAAVRAFALEYPIMGYKRLTWLMVDKDVAALSTYRVEVILREAGLLRTHTLPPKVSLSRPPAAKRPDEQWHIDIMYLLVASTWYYLVDIIDAYSRYLVHWSLNTTMRADTVTLTVQEALDKLPERRAGEPKIVHDHGSQFMSSEWRSLVAGNEVTDIVTRVAHPQSNGVVERLHRTHREEIFDNPPDSYYNALDIMEAKAAFYNHERPHSALHYLCPVDYYRGSPEARLLERQQKLARAFETRQLFWEQNRS
jgi:transposase InsO family protein